MKKRGFTLIELLAVIVVLAIIALIATPIVMNVIKKANEGAAERSADNYVKAVETLIATEKLDGTPLVDGEYTINTDGKLKKDGKEYEVEVSGTKPVGGKVVIEGGKIVKESSTIDYTDYTVTYSDGKANAEAKTEETKKLMTLADCDLKEGQTALAIGAAYDCDPGDGVTRTFYLLEKTTSMVSLIMDRNIAGPVAWNEDGGAEVTTALTALNNATAGWSNVNVSLPTYDQLNSFWNSESDEITSDSEYSWLISGLEHPKDGGYPLAYWTSTYHGSGYYEEPSAYLVTGSGYLNGHPITANYSGVRPVITISKDNMSL